MSAPLLHMPVVTDYGEPDGILGLAVTRFLAGVSPHVVSRKLRGDVTLTDDVFASLSLRLSHSTTLSRRVSQLWVGDEDRTAVVVSARSRQVRLQVFGPSPQAARDLCVALVRALPVSDKPANETGPVPVEFMHWSSRHGLDKERRFLPEVELDSIRENYVPAVVDAIAPLMPFNPSRSGRLLLLHGPPGSGKTTLLNSLATMWRRDVTFQHVLDPDVLFSSMDYLHAALLEGTQSPFPLLDAARFGEVDDSDDDAEDDAPSADGWRLLVLEDADELIAGDARARSGPALSRLLNVTDGALGSATRTLVAVTTNEPVVSLHPALLRPGRCLANIEVPALPARQANSWLSARGVARSVSQPTTLAELFALADGAQLPVPPPSPGLYL